jgi:competence ComEA-like helix-hairpin-helix protein
VLRHKRDREGWRKIVETMDANGARVTADEIKALVDYLFANFGLSDEEKRASERINVNKASASRLAKALRLFPSETEVIVAYREKHGDFQSIDDLAKVPGLDMQTLQAVKDRLVFK